jgi:hypothetical protein
MPRHPPAALSSLTKNFVEPRYGAQRGLPLQPVPRQATLIKCKMFSLSTAHFLPHFIFWQALLLAVSTFKKFIQFSPENSSSATFNN